MALKSLIIKLFATLNVTATFFFFLNNLTTPFEGRVRGTGYDKNNTIII